MAPLDRSEDGKEVLGRLTYYETGMGDSGESEIVRNIDRTLRHNYELTSNEKSQCSDSMISYELRRQSGHTK